LNSNKLTHPGSSPSSWQRLSDELEAVKEEMDLPRIRGHRVKQYCRGVGKTMGDARKKYTKEFKLDAIRLLESGTKPGHEIERDLGIGSGQIYRWRKQFSEDGARAFPGNGKSRDEELAALRKEVKELREERDILRKATAIFSRPPK
jgi:transposase